MDEIRLSGGASIDPQSTWQQLSGGAAENAFVASLGRMIVSRRWYGSKTRTIRSLGILDAVPLSDNARILLLDVQYTAGQGEVYQIPLALAAGEQARHLLADASDSVWVRLTFGNGNDPAILFDALEDRATQSELLRLTETKAAHLATDGGLAGWRTPQFGRLHGGDERALAPRLLRSEQSNSSIVYGDRLILKLFRRVETGLNPDVEITARLTERGYEGVPPLAGGLDYLRAGHEPWTLAMAQGFVPNQGDGWHHILRWLAAFLARELGAGLGTSAAPAPPTTDWSTAARQPIPAPAEKAFGEYLGFARRLGTRTAQMHIELAADATDPAFAPDPFTAADGRSFAERAQGLARETFELLRNQLPKLGSDLRADAEQLLARESAIAERFERLATDAVEVAKIRCHGDYHLGQVLVSGDDYYIIDFEGEPARPLVERRQKQLAMRDVAGMIRSYHYASCSAAHEFLAKMPQADASRINQWMASWYCWTSVAFLSAYKSAAGAAVFAPAADEEFQRLLAACLLEKAIYELRYELNNRPAWVYLPLRALGETLGTVA